MPGTNGRTDIVGPPIQLGDFLPERRAVVINGQQYVGWVTTNRRYPRAIMAKLDKAARGYNRVIQALLEPLAEGEEISQERLQAADEQPEAWSSYVAQAVLLLVPNLLESEIELIDLPSLENLLRELGYFPPLPEPDQVTDESKPVEAAGPANEENAETHPLTTGATPRDASPVSTELVPTNS